ncbi:hypothetical protein AgCh_031785 [Apium graveolens]
MDSIDIINLAAAKLESNDKLLKIDVAAAEKELKEKWRKIDAEILQKFGPIQKPDKVFYHHSQVKHISVDEMSLNYLEKGQTSCIKSPKANLVMKPKINYSKFSDKNPVDIVYETPRPDEKKLLARSIEFYKDPADSTLKRRLAKFYRNGKEIGVVDGHPMFVEAKKEEKERIRQEKKQTVLDAKKLKQKKNDEEMDDYIPKKSTTSTQTSKPSMVFEEFKVVDPTRNIHGEPIIPKDEPVDWNSLPVPKLNLLIFNKPKKTKTRASQKVKLVTLRSKTLTKSQSTVNKGDLILLESQYVLIKIYSSFKKNFGYNVTTRRLVLKKIEELRSNKAKDALPKTLTIPFTGKRVHLRPYWLMEFRDEKGVRRFFRLEDQLSISSNETLLEMQEMLGDNVIEEEGVYLDNEDNAEDNVLEGVFELELNDDLVFEHVPAKRKGKRAKKYQKDHPE